MPGPIGSTESQSFPLIVQIFLVPPRPLEALSYAEAANLSSSRGLQLAGPSRDAFAPLPGTSECLTNGVYL